MDKKRGIINVAVSIIFRILLLISSLLVRRYLIRFIGNEANGLDSLYTSIIGVLSVAELGIGTAITFCMYRPIVDGDNDRVSALYYLFKRDYILVGAVISVAGCAVMPFLPYLAKGYTSVNVNIYFTFALMLLSVVLTYTFSAKTSLINAYKNNYVTTTINSSAQLLQYLAQIVVLMLTKSFVWYLVCRSFAVLVQWGITEIVIQKSYKGIIKNRQKIDSVTRSDVTKRIKAMFMHKIGGVLVNTADSIIISAFVGVTMLGKYSNYSIIMTAMTGTITLFFTPLTSIIGHLFVEENAISARKYYNFFYLFNFVVGVVFFLGYYAVIDDLIIICFGSGLNMLKAVPFIITLNYFIQFMRQATLLFRDASGTFYNDRWKPLFEGLVNIVLSIAFVFLFEYLFGADFAVVGVIVATIITNLTICHVVEPYVLYKYAFHMSPKKYYLKNYTFIFVFCVLLFALNATMVTHSNEFIEMIINGSISLAYSLVLTVILMITNKGARQYVGSILQKLRRKRKVENIDNVDKIENFNSPD